MEPISNADRLVALLRLKLQERAKASAAKGAKTKARGVNPFEPLGVQGLAAIEGADDRQLRRAFVQNLLVDQLGAALTNDARFQQIVSRVTETIEDDAEAAALLNRLVDALRPS